MNEEKIKNVIEEFVDYLSPELTPYESSVYIYLLRNSFLKNSNLEVRVGKRTIAAGFGKGSRGVKTNYEHVSKILKLLEEKQCIKVGNTNRDGTLYIVNLPRNIPLVNEKIKRLIPSDIEEDYFTNPGNRLKIFERDKWFCQYCGDKITTQNATIDHYVPQCNDGKHNKENLRTCCLICNSIKSGKTFEEAAPFLLKSIQERKLRSHRGDT
jgi:HNH endonuclease